MPGCGTPAAEMASRSSRVLRSVAAVSTSRVAPPSLMKPALLRHQLPFGDQFAPTVQMQEENTGHGRSQPVAVAPPECRAADDSAEAGAFTGPACDGVEPGFAILVVQRVAGRHLGDVRRRVEVVRLGV